ncbi:Phenylalanyl-tRNA synthetase subunit alpha PheS [Helicobacter sp. NHP19-012]|uniref:Phenylalanine--tRNA ligase alpha subunit n=1 Tax=Helicobacter gastrofelis TaxID=2849642 RepID=A0ABN6IA48_9HELI|nr:MULTISPECIES: phenylalanine--tRNA ligase subunit alpha [unclassified Helicobacter]BCZ18988.1 Phenylalanyl-tRNA synthetase subunit alpha PheS [Helicobacter sp. NHP19-012]GMB96296.1 Phenylalanyl-tRNA synthetase subunit alpha PheS [Helicobacter sp. NHP22-001]
MQALQAALEKLEEVKDLHTLEELRLLVLGKKGLLAHAFAGLKELEQEEKTRYAQELNRFKESFSTLHAQKKQALQALELQVRLEAEKIDVSLANTHSGGSLGHPLNYTKERIITHFTQRGFKLHLGALVEDDFHNFSALNIPPHHPARAMQDTFYFKDHKLLRTHTSPSQIHAMQTQTPPIKMIAVGHTFRRDYDTTHTPMFSQVEGLVVDTGVHFGHLKQVLEEFLNAFFGSVKVRWRSSFFPFTEPSAEVDMSCVFCQQKGCKVCKNTGWLEVLGAGLVHPEVFKNVGLEGMQGYAFGLGIERLAMLSCEINDLRSFFETDLRMLEAF